MVVDLDKQHEMKNIQEELNRREEMISNINQGLLKAKDEASNTYSDLTKQNNRLKIALKQVQNAYEELFKKHTSVEKSHNNQLKRNEKAILTIKTLKDVVEEQQKHIQHFNAGCDEKERKFEARINSIKEEAETKELEYKSKINECLLLLLVHPLHPA